MVRLGLAAVAALVGVGAAAMGGQARPVLLRIMPRVGDTLRMRFEQEYEMTGSARTVAGRDTTVTQRSEMLVLSRSIVERAGAAGALVLAITDSVVLRAVGADPRAIDAARRAMQGRRSWLRVTPAGATELVKGDGDATGPAHARFPGTLPTESVSVGATWTRELPLPWGGDAASRGGGKLAVVFRLDSLAAGGALAHVSLRGALSRRSGPNKQGAHAATTGQLTGALLVDLRRGWMTDSRTTFVMSTVVTPPPGRGDAPARVKLRVTQRLRAM